MVVHRPWLAWISGFVLALLLAPGWAAQADGELPGRVGRLLPLAGAVSVFDPDNGGWQAAAHNLPLTSGDRVATAAGARAELRIGSTVLRLAAATELELQRIDDDSMVFELHGGSLALNLRSNELADQIAIVTAQATLRPQRSGSYRVDSDDAVTLAASQRGVMLVDGAEGWRIGNGQRVEIRRDPRHAGDLRLAWAAPANDEFASWIASADRDDERVAASGHVSPEMTGAEDLERHGRWDHHPEHGAVWLPHSVAPGWAPYSRGHWAWLRPWGWTWVDAAPWGFAPFHYGRWVSWGGRWCWSPGVFVARPVYAPALVRWVGAPPPPHWHGRNGRPPHPGVGWVPLAPHETFVPMRPVAPGAGERRKPSPPQPGTVQVFRANPGVQTAAPYSTEPSRPVSRPRAAPVQVPVQVPAPAPAPAMPARPQPAVVTRPVMPPAPAIAPPVAPPVFTPRPFNAAAGPAAIAPADVRTRPPEPRGRATGRQAER